MGVFDVLQIPYSALQPEHEDTIAAAARAGMGIVIRGGVAKGTSCFGVSGSDLYNPAYNPRKNTTAEIATTREAMDMPVINRMASPWV